MLITVRERVRVTVSNFMLTPYFSPFLAGFRICAQWPADQTLNRGAPLRILSLKLKMTVRLCVSSVN